MGWLNWQALVSTECFLWIKNPHKNPYWQKFWKGGRYVPRNALPGAVSSCNSVLSAAFSLCKYRKYELGAEGSVKLYLVMCSAWDVRQITCIQEEMDFKSQIKANIPNQWGWWMRFLVFELTLSAFPGQAFFFIQVNETEDMVSDQTIHLWKKAIRLVTQQCNMDHIQSQWYEERHFKVDRGMYFTGASKSLLILFNFQGLSLLIQTALSSSCPGWCLSICLPPQAERPSFCAPNPAPEKLACTDLAVMKSRQAGRLAQWQQEEPICSQLLASTAGLLRASGWAPSSAWWVGRSW